MKEECTKIKLKPSLIHLITLIKKKKKKKKKKTISIYDHFLSHNFFPKLF